MSSLFSATIESVVPAHQKLLVLDSNTSLVDALKILSARNIYSAPVKDKAGTFYGFLDMIDIVLFLVGLMDEKMANGKEFQSFLESVQELNLQNAKNIADLSATNPLIPLRSTDTIADALKIFEQTGTHRIPILKANADVADIQNVLTQIDVISWMATHIKSLGSNRHKSLKEIDVSLKKVISVDLKTSAFEAFKTMAEYKITAVAVLNPDGTLLSNLSAKDIKEVAPENLMMWMNKTALEYVQMVRSKQVNVSYPVYACHLHNTLEEIVMKLSVLRVHRLYITDQHNKPIGILSLGDLFRLMGTPSTTDSH